MHGVLRSISSRTRTSRGSQAAHPRRGPAHRSQHRQAAGAAAAVLSVARHCGATRFREATVTDNSLIGINVRACAVPYQSAMKARRTVRALWPSRQPIWWRKVSAGRCIGGCADAPCMGDEDAQDLKQARMIVRSTIIVAVLLSGFLLTASPAAVSQKGLAEATALSQQVTQLYSLGRYSEAIPLAQRVVALHEKTLGPDHPALAADLNTLAELYLKQGRYADVGALSQTFFGDTRKGARTRRPRCGGFAE
jgi:hypothetical protein